MSRKIVLTKEQIAQVEALAAYLSIEDICAYLGISQASFFALKKKEPELLGAYNRGVASARALVASKLFEVINSTELTPSKVQAIMFYLRTQGGWSEKSQVAVTTKDVTPKLPIINISFSDDWKNESKKELI